jgi:hypothetical protein
MADRSGIAGLNVPQDEIISDGADLFTAPAMNNDYVDGFNQEYYPVTGISAGGPYEFLISSDGPHYINLPLTRLFGSFKIVRKDGVAMKLNEAPGFVNMLPSSLFKHVEIEVNGKPVSDSSSNCYGIKAYIDTILSYGMSAKFSHLKSGWFLQDTAYCFDTLGAENKGLASRRIMLKGGVTKDFETIIHSDFFQIYRLLPNRCNIRLKFIKNEDSFMLLNENDEYKIVIQDLRVTVRKVELNKALFGGNEKMFEQGKPAILPLVRSQIKSFVVSSGLTSITQPNIISGQLPRNVIIAFLSSSAVNNNFRKNPFNFQHFNVRSTNLRVNGICTPTVPYITDFKNGNFMRAFRGLSDSTGISHSNGGNYLSPEGFAGGCTFFAFDLTPDQCNGFHEHTRKAGVIDLELTFETALTEPINIIVYSSFDNFITLDKYRNLVTDFSV